MISGTRGDTSACEGGGGTPLAALLARDAIALQHLRADNLGVFFGPLIDPPKVIQRIAELELAQSLSGGR